MTFKSPVLEAVLTILSQESTTDLSDAQTFARIPGHKAAEFNGMTVRERNGHVIEWVRKTQLSIGHFAAWAALMDVCSNLALPKALVADVSTSIRIYNTIRPATPRTGRPAAAGLRITITRGESHDSIYHVSPKNLGGKGWLASEEYSWAIRTWANTGFEPLSPCVAFGWLGTQRKAIARSDVDDCDAMTLLGAVDFDMDRGERFARAFARALSIAKRHTADLGTKMQGTALAALVNYEVQQYVRPIQEEWVRSGRGAANFGPHAISAEDWVAMAIADNASLCGFAYQGATRYTDNKVGGFAALVLSNTHDLLYDLATSNLMSSVMYAAAAGVTQDNIHCIFITSFVDQIARRVCEGAGYIEDILFGDNAIVASGAWAGFSERYRTWERFVKYSRQIARSTSAEAQHIATRATDQLVINDCDFVDVANAWRQVTTPNSCNLVQRSTVPYVPGAAPEIAEGLLPVLCIACMVAFETALNGFESDEVRAVEGLSSSIAGCRAVARAAAIRRAALFAAGGSCCDICACRIGRWADMISHKVLTALISSEQTASAPEWLLQCYAVWSVMSSPVSVATILSGFDLCCEFSQDEGAMGNRDVLDC